MDRRGFLRRFGIGAAAAVAAPSIVKAALPEPKPAITPEEYHIDKCRAVRKAHIRQYPMTPDECYTSSWEEMIKRYGERVSIFDYLNLMNQ